MSEVSDEWKPVGAEEWWALEPAPLPNPREDIDANYWSIESIPVLGGNAFYYEGGARLPASDWLLRQMTPTFFTKNDRKLWRASEGASLRWWLLTPMPINVLSRSDVSTGVNPAGVMHSFARQTTRA